MTLLAAKKKPKRKALVNMGRRFREPVCQIPLVEDSSEEDENHIGEAKSTQDGCINDQVSNDEDYFDEQYPPANVKYKQLEDRLKAVEIQAVPSLDFDDLGLISGVVIPHKFKIPVFAKYDGVSYPKLHLKSYMRKIHPHTADKKFGFTVFKKVWLGCN